MNEDLVETRVKLPIKIIMVAGLMMVIGGYWDAWWHVNIGRDDIWIPPHMMMYGSFVTILVFFTYLLFRGNLNRLKWGVVTGFLILISAIPIDDWWHTFNPPEVGLGLMSPPHMYFAVGGAIAGVYLMKIVAEKTRKFVELRKYLFLYIFAGYLMSMQAIGLIDPSNTTYLGYFGSALFAAVTSGFYIFTKGSFRSHYVVILGLGEGIAKTLLESSLLYITPIVLSALLVAKLHNQKSSPYSLYVLTKLHLIYL